MTQSKVNHKGTVRLETKRLILRKMNVGDAAAMFRNWTSDPEVTKYLRWQPNATVADGEAILMNWENNKFEPDVYRWAIELKEIKEPIGSISVVARQDDIKMVRIGYCIGRKWWQQGYTTEALKEVVRFFFEEVGINRLEATYDPRNKFSGRVMLKSGLKYEGTYRQADISNAGIGDSVVCAIIADDYFQRRKADFQINIGNLAIDCQDPDATCSFYEALTGWQRLKMYNCSALIAENGLVLLFMACDFTYIAPVWPEEGHRQQKQMHLDFQVDCLDAAVDQAIKLGATKAESQYGGDQFVTMIDPEGHPFCLCRQ